MGTYYALADGEPAEAAVAIREHYLPRGAGDALPETAAGVALAIADKLDTVAGIFQISERPSGTKDPFGLRRAAIGVLRIIIEKQLDLDLRQLIGSALAAIREDVARIRANAAPATPANRAQTTADGQEDTTGTQIYDFIMERLRAYYLERVTAAGPAAAATLSSEMFDAVLATRPVSPLDFDARLKALAAFLELPEATSLATANKRIANILRKSGERPQTEVEVEHLREPAEVRLFDAMQSLRESVSTSLARREYAAALGRLAQLRPPVDAFFEQVMVMDEDPKLRANRLTLLAQLHGLFGGIADLSRLPG